jgi:hypothetical protein
MTAAALLALAASLLPLRDAADAAVREEIVAAAIAVTNDDQEQALLVSIAKWESGYRDDVMRCRVRGRFGEVSAWQILIRNDGERAALCRSVAGDARIALERIRESVRACRHLPAPERLAVYARGRCNSDEGRRLSRERWVTVGGER